MDELKAFDASKITGHSPPELAALRTAIEGTLVKVFGPNTLDYDRYRRASDLNTVTSIRFGGGPTPVSHYQQVFQGSKERSLALLEQAIKEMEEELAGRGPDASAEVYAEHAANLRSREFHPKKIFVVHGRAGEEEAVARFISQMGLEPVILHERPNKGRTIITKFREEADDIGFAVVLMTPDDTGGPKDGQMQPRARQNVVFELGFFIGRLGPEKVAALVKGEIERPSDFDGVLYIPHEGDWKMSLAREFQSAGYEVDWNKIMRS